LPRNARGQEQADRPGNGELAQVAGEIVGAKRAGAAPVAVGNAEERGAQGMLHRLAEANEKQHQQQRRIPRRLRGQDERRTRQRSAADQQDAFAQPLR